MTSPAPVYALHGLRLRSAVPLTGHCDGADGHDVDVRWARGKRVPHESPPGRLVLLANDAGSFRYAAALDDAGRWTLRVPGFADFVVERDRRTVRCRLDPSADIAFVAILVSGLVPAFLLTGAGECVLHASAVALDGRAVAFAGPSGSGKTTLAALACAAGARLVTDDVLRVDLDLDAACVGGSPQLRLREGAAWALDHFASRPAARLTADERLAVVPETTDAPRVPLSSIVLPRLSRTATSTVVTPLKGAASVAALAGVSRVTGWTDDEVLVAQFRAFGRLSSRVPVVEAWIPWRQRSAPPDLEPLLAPLAATR